MTEIESGFLDRLCEMNPEIALSDHQMNQLRLYYENLVLWNRKMNLTGITKEEDVYIKHYLDSYTLFQCVPCKKFHEGNSIIDIGTGAGFPGIPLAILMPEIHVTLVDALGKRIRFLEETKQKIKLENVTCIHARSEDLAHEPAHREHYDYAVSRAVANLSTISEYCIPFLQMGGSFIAYKSEKVDEELKGGIKAAQILGAQLERREDFRLPGTDYHRTLLQFVKRNATPHKYPRKAGTPSRQPLE